jgi:uncharacterized protein (DUF1015 family)
MARILPTVITRPIRNKACIFPSEEDCDLTSSDINSIIRRNPYSFNNIMFKPYIKKLTGIKKYNAIRRQYEKFKKNNIIRIDENPGFYIYNIIDKENNEFTGIVAKIPHSEFLSGKIVKVEKSDSEWVEENFQRIKNTGFITKPFTVVHDQNEEIENIFEKYKSKIPLYEFTRNNGCIHEVWQIIDPCDVEFIMNAFQKIDKFYIVDDNDRFDASHKIYQEKTNIFQDTHSGMEAYNFFPAFLISKEKIKIYEYKKGIPVNYPADINQVLTTLQKDFNIQEINHYEQPEKGEILLYSLQGKYSLTPKKHINSDLPDALIFNNYILSALSLEDTKIKSKSLKYCSGKRSLKCVENQLNKENCKFGFILKPIEYTGIETFAANNYQIPYKSMYVEPRLLRGLFIYEI